MRFFLLSHSSGLKGPINFLEDYLQKMSVSLYHLEHPLDTYENKYTYLYKDRKILYKKKRTRGNIKNLCIDFVISFIKVAKSPYDIFIGGNNFDTLSGILLRTLRINSNKKIIYFSSDFSENRYTSASMNILYLAIEKFVLRNADLVISNTKRAEKKRISLGLEKKKSLVIPNGVYLDKPVFKYKNLQKDNFIYIGNVTQEHGIFDFIAIIKPYIKKLVIIGQGDQWEDMKKYCRKYNIPATFMYKLAHDKTITYLQQFKGFGLAPYTQDAGWTFYSSPLKVNEYIASGVPVIMSNIPEISSIVEKERLGIVYNPRTIKDISSQIRDFNDKDFYQKAKNFYKVYSYDTVYKSIDFDTL